MALSPDDKINLLVVAKGYWIFAESNVYAYQRAFAQAKQWGDWLKIATIISALLTTASGFVADRWLTVVAGLLTTALASGEKLFLPSEKYQKHWNCRAELAGVQRNLTSFAINLDGVPDVSAGTKPLDQMNEKLIAITRDNPITPIGEDQKTADSVFAAGVLARMIAQAETRAGRALTGAAENMADLPEDAPAVVAVFRTRKSA